MYHLQGVWLFCKLVFPFRFLLYLISIMLMVLFSQSMDVAIYGWVVLLLLLLLPVVHAQAPGDGDSFCTSPSILLPTYPPNTKILMDSYSYLNLLPSPVTPAGGVWQEVDVDGELGGITTQVCSVFSMHIIPCKIP